MSWDSYIDNLLAQSKDTGGEVHVDTACIIGLDGGAKWTTDGHTNALKATATECADVSRCFKSRDFTSMMANGIYLTGVKFQFIREEDNKLVLAKKKEYGSISMQCSKTAIVMAHIPEGKQQGNANKAVAVIADYLESMNM